MKFLFLMDPLETVVMDHDTSFILMLGSHRRGHEVFFLPDGGTSIKENRIHFQVTPVIPQKSRKTPFLCKKSRTLTHRDVDAVFIRTDPPFDLQYLVNTWLLDRLPPSIPVINRASGIRTVNEKIWATNFPSLIPRTLISRQRQELLGFLSKEKSLIAKPTDGHGGISVFQVKNDDKNARVILETMTQKWTREIILQQYLPAARHGDKRILLLDGEPLGATLRVHSPQDHRNNIFAGGKEKPASLTARDKEIVRTLKPELRRLGLYFVGIDVIGGYLTEVNVTSPTCLQEMNRFNHQRLENKVIDFVEKLVDRCKAEYRIGR